MNHMLVGGDLIPGSSRMSKIYGPVNLNQREEHPPPVQSRSSEIDPVCFILDTAAGLDISTITAKYQQEQRLQYEIHRFLSEAETADEQEDQLNVTDRRGRELSEQLVPQRISGNNFEAQQLSDKTTNQDLTWQFERYDTVKEIQLFGIKKTK